MQTSDKPIGIFDSGVGGLTVAREIIEQLPKEGIVYFGDTARVPYGSKSKEAVTRFALKGIRFLLAQDVKMVVVACNTVSATCLDEIQEMIHVPVVGVIEPGARAAVKATKTKNVGIIGTERTINSGAYVRAIYRLDGGIRICSRACPLFVPLVEEGWLDNEAVVYTAKRYLEPFIKKGVDTLVLACTHYPLLKPILQTVMGGQVRLVDSAFETARKVGEILKRLNLEHRQDSPTNYSYFVSDNPEKFIEVGEGFLGRSIQPISVIDPEVGK
jgi:glutamate racemase